MKMSIGCAYQLPEELTYDVTGMYFPEGKPKTITITSDEALEALHDPCEQIVEAVHSVLEKTPPELAADIAGKGIVLTGGGSLLKGLDQLIEENTGINTIVAEDPMSCVAIGTGQFVEFLSNSGSKSGD